VAQRETSSDQESKERDKVRYNMVLSRVRWIDQDREIQSGTKKSIPRWTDWAKGRQKEEH
jgi:hypothetical protein